MVPVVTRPEQVREPVHKVQPVARTRHVRQLVRVAVPAELGVMALGPTTAVVHVPETGEPAITTVLAHTAVMVTVPK